MILMETHKIVVPPTVVISGIMMAVLGHLVFEHDGKYFRFKTELEDESQFSTAELS